MRNNSIYRISFYPPYLQKICYSLSLEMKANGNEIIIYKNNH